MSGCHHASWAAQHGQDASLWLGCAGHARSDLHRGQRSAAPQHRAGKACARDPQEEVSVALSVGTVGCLACLCMRSGRAFSSADAVGTREQLHASVCRDSVQVVYEGLYRVVDAWQEPEGNIIACKCVQFHWRGSLAVLMMSSAGSALTALLSQLLVVDSFCAVWCRFH